MVAPTGRARPSRQDRAIEAFFEISFGDSRLELFLGVEFRGVAHHPLFVGKLMPQVERSAHSKKGLQARPRIFQRLFEGRGCLSGGGRDAPPALIGWERGSEAPPKLR